MLCRSAFECIHFACKHTHLTVHWQTPVHHETETKAPFRLGLSVNRAFPMRRSHSSILPANSWHWTTAEPTSMFLSVHCLYNEAGSWRLVLDGTETHNEWFCLVSFHFASHHMRSCESGCVRRSALYHAGRSRVPLHEVSWKERQFAIKWKRDRSDTRHTLLGQMLQQRGNQTVCLWGDVWLQPQQEVETWFHTVHPLWTSSSTDKRLFFSKHKSVAIF